MPPAHGLYDAPVKAIETSLPGVVLIEPRVHGDDRGFFVETYRESEIAALGITDRFVQDNQSRSARGVIRGMHFQVGANPQAKLIRCARGAILDVVCDIRHRSPTFGAWEAFLLDDETCRQLYCPIGFAHGFQVLSDVADVVYRCSAYYSAHDERGISPDDPDLAIAWRDIPRIMSDRDLSAPRLHDIADSLPFTFAP